MRFAFRVDAAPQIGYGHISRCISIAARANELGYQSYFIRRQERNPSERGKHPLELLLNRFGPTIEMKPPKKGRTDSYQTWLGADHLQDAKETLQISEHISADLLIVDHYGVNEEWFSWVSSIPTLYLSDHPSPKGPNFVLDYGFDATREKHQSAVETDAKTFLGTEFALVKETRETRGSKINNEKMPIVALVLGSKFPKDAIPVIGRLVKAHSDKQFLAADPAGLLSPLINIANFSFWDINESVTALLQKSAFGIVSASVSMYELLAAGIPGVVLQTAANQRGAFEKGQQIGAILGIDFLQPTNWESLSESFEIATSEDRKIRELVSKSAVDGHGAGRLIELLVPSGKAVLLRPVQDADLPLLFRWANDDLVRRAASNTETIEPQTHLDWFNKLGLGHSLCWMAEVSGIPVGQVRVDFESDGAWLTYSIDKEFRRRGYAREAIRKAQDAVGPTTNLFAKVRNWNEASLACLISCKFVLRDVGAEFSILEWKAGTS